MLFDYNESDRFQIRQAFYSEPETERVLGSTNDYDDAIYKVLGLEVNGSCCYTVWDKKAICCVFQSDETGHAGFGSVDEIPLFGITTPPHTAAGDAPDTAQGE